MADRTALPLATKKVYEIQWAQRTRKRPKTGVFEPEIPMGGAPAIFNRRFRRPGRLWAQNKADRAREEGLSGGIPANFAFEIWTNLGDFGH